MSKPKYDRTLLGAAALGALEPDEQRSVDEHVATCNDCWNELADLMKLKDHLGLVPPEAFLDCRPGNSQGTPRGEPSC
jgi:anti-sigma factor RsiW